jgi:hypothetical protein
VHAKDPNAPKKALSAFQFYRKHLIESDEEINAMSFGVQSHEVGKRWGKLSDDEKEEFLAMNEKDKKR